MNRSFFTAQKEHLFERLNLDIERNEIGLYSICKRSIKKKTRA